MPLIEYNQYTDLLNNKAQVWAFPMTFVISKKVEVNFRFYLHLRRWN